MLSLSNLLADLTATSARPLEEAWYALLVRCRTPHRCRKSRNSLDAYSGPPSLLSSSGMPNEIKDSLQVAMRPLEPDSSVCDLARQTSTQLVNLSTVSR